MDLIEKLNLPDDLRAEYADKELTGENLDALLEAHNSALFDQHREALAHDEKFTKTFFDKGHASAKGAMEESSRRVLKSLGYEGEYEDENGAIPSYKIFERYAQGLQEKARGKSKGSEELEGRLTEANRARVELEEAVKEGTHPKIAALTQELNALKSAQSQMESRAWLGSLLVKDYTISRDKVVRLVEEDARARGWKIARTDSGLEFTDGAGNKIRTEKGDRVLTTAEVVAELEKEYIKRSNAAGTTTTTTAETRTTTIDPRIEKRQREAARLTKSAEHYNSMR